MTNVTIFTKTGCVEVPGVEVGHVLVHQPYFIEPRDNYWVKIDPKAKTCKHMRKVRLRYHTNSLAERPTHRVIGYPAPRRTEHSRRAGLRRVWKGLWNPTRQRPVLGPPPGNSSRPSNAAWLDASS